jgi:uncharacterized protein (DUF488 family)
VAGATPEGGVTSASLVTVGHGTLGPDELRTLLVSAGVERVVDVRRFPGSRTSPHVARAILEQWLPAGGVDYRWEERLGGRRALPKDAPVADTWWTVAAFRAYAAYTRTPEFAAGLASVLADAAAHRVAVMCSESVWWRCHRRLIADVVLLAHELPVEHLMPSGQLRPHVASDGARRSGHQLVWDG